MKNLAVLTSGGDSPGMNACIKAVARTAAYHRIKAFGVMRGYEGLIDNDFIALDAEAVSNIIHKGGTVLKTARSERFRTPEGLQRAADNLKARNIEGLVIIGGDGSFKGALALAGKCDTRILGAPGTIDNDLVGTDFTIGYDTAVNTVIEAIDKIRDTAESHDRIFVVEVMGRDAGLIALRSAIGGGAEALLVPEMNNDMETLLTKIKSWRQSKRSRIIVVAEGDQSGGAFKVAEVVKKADARFDVRVSVLGHIQRGGNPSCMERVNASLMGYHAVKGLLEGRHLEMVGIINREIAFTPFEKAVKHHEQLNPTLTELIEILST